MIGCKCEVCTSKKERNKRLRSSLYIQTDQHSLLIDTSPDFREQALRYEIRKVDAILLTHAHVDHLFGLDDIRRINTIQGTSIPLYSSPEALKDVERIFDYIFKPSIKGTFRPKLELLPINDTLQFGELSVTPVEVEHGLSRTFGYRFDYQDISVAYIPDCHTISEASISKLESLDYLILDTLKYEPHPTHLSLSEALTLIDQIKAEKVLLTHIGHRFDHDTLTSELISRGYTNAAPAYDGLTITL